MPKATQNAKQSKPKLKTQIDWVTKEARSFDKSNQRKQTVAIIVVHGMGQQVPFESIDAIASIITEKDRFKASSVQQVDGTLLARGECTFDDHPVEAHIYEGFWSPLTQAKVNFFETILFLLQAAKRGSAFAKEKTFNRWIENDWEPYTTEEALGNQMYVVLSIVVLLAIVLIGIPLLYLAWFFKLIENDTLTAFLPDYLAITVSFVCALLSVKSATECKARSVARRAFSNATKVFLCIYTLCLAYVSTHLVCQLFKFPEAFFFYTNEVEAGKALLEPSIKLFSMLSANITDIPMLHPFIERLNFSVPMIFTTAIWLSALATVVTCTNIVTDYIGDLAIYLSSNEVNKFYVIRQKIKDAVRLTFRTVYEAKVPGESADQSALLYDKIIVVAHSLGSVIAYDALNELIAHELIASESNVSAAANRTELFVTFGSPLDKTAFFFQSQLNQALYRDALSVTRQPMICDYKYRPKFWVNIHSPQDIISGKLDLYDRKKSLGNPKAVKNVVDEDADVYLLAHNQYWTNNKLKSILLAYLTGGESALEKVLPTK